MEASKWILVTRNKLKLTLGLLLLATLLFAANLFEKRQVASMDQSFLSIYEDRLVPATSIFEIRENLYRKRELLKDMLHPASQDIAAQQSELATCNLQVEHLLEAYKKTFFLEKESGVLLAFEQDLQTYDQLERNVIRELSSGNTPMASRLFDEDALPHFKTAVLKLAQLNQIQSEIGKDMVSNSKKKLASFLLLSDLEMALILLFSVVAHILIYASRSLFRPRTEPFNLN